MTLEAQMVKKIDRLSRMEGVLRVEKKWLRETEHIQIWTWRASSRIQFGLSKGVLNLLMDDRLVAAIDWVET
jgi:hypothetical protein